GARVGVQRVSGGARWSWRRLLRATSGAPSEPDGHEAGEQRRHRARVLAQPAARAARARVVLAPAAQRMRPIDLFSPVVLDDVLDPGALAVVARWAQRLPGPAAGDAAAWRRRVDGDPAAVDPDFDPAVCVALAQCQVVAEVVPLAAVKAVDRAGRHADDA